MKFNSAPQKLSLSTLWPQTVQHQQCLCCSRPVNLYLESLPLIVWQLPPQYNVSWMQQISTFLWDSVSNTSQTLHLRAFTLSVPTLNFLRCLLDSLQWPDPASHTWQEAKLETLPMELWCLLAPPNSDSIVVITIKILERLFVFSVLADIPTQFLTASEHACRSPPQAVGFAGALIKKDHRGISLLSIAGKILARVLLNRLNDTWNGQGFYQKASVDSGKTEEQ